MVKDRCDKYNNKNTMGLGKNFVYKHCKRCPNNKTWKIYSGSQRKHISAGESCHDTGIINKEKDRLKKLKTKCVYYKFPYNYSKVHGYPCRGKGEKEYRKYLDEDVKNYPDKKSKKIRKQKLKELDEFYKNQEGGKTKKKKKTRRTRRTRKKRRTRRSRRTIKKR